MRKTQTHILPNVFKCICIHPYINMVRPQVLQCCICLTLAKYVYSKFILQYDYNVFLVGKEEEMNVATKVICPSIKHANVRR